jgi:hypothetical protein
MSEYWPLIVIGAGFIVCHIRCCWWKKYNP